MTQVHPITPPPELRLQWLAEGHHQDYCSATEYAIAQAAQWGADQELEACVEWMGDSPVVWRGDPEAHPGFYLREARRPKPPSLKEQALTVLDRIEFNSMAENLGNEKAFDLKELEVVRRALKRLPE